MRKTWEMPQVEELRIEETAYGKNLNAREANANKHHNNGAGGKQPVTPPTTPPTTPPDGSLDTDYTSDVLS